MAPHSSTLAWKIPWMEEYGRLQFMGSQRVGHDWASEPMDILLVSFCGCHRLTGLKQTKFILHFQRPEAIKTKVSAGLYSSGRFQGRIRFLCFFSLQRSYTFPGSQSSFYHQSQQQSIFRFLFFSVLLLPSSFLWPCFHRHSPSPHSEPLASPL